VIDARQLCSLDYGGRPSTDPEPPAFPENFDNINPAAQAETQDLYPGMSLAARCELCVWCRYGGGQLSLISIRLHYWIWNESESNARPTYLWVT
jgi:hypothetical protein